MTDCPDYEDNWTLEAALASEALIIVANDSRLLHMSPWKGIPIITARQFAGSTQLAAPDAADLRGAHIIDTGTDSYQLSCDEPRG